MVDRTEYVKKKDFDDLDENYLRFIELARCIENSAHAFIVSYNDFTDDERANIADIFSILAQWDINLTPDQKTKKMEKISNYLDTMGKSKSNELNEFFASIMKVSAFRPRGDMGCVPRHICH